MSVSITFYHNAADARVVDKSNQITSIKSVSASFIDDVSILNPILELRYDSDIFTSNYLYISTLDRYYYIEDITTSNNKLYIKCKCDVLMSNKNAIKNSTCIIDRQENVYNKYLNDPLYEGYSYEILSAYKLGNIFTKASQPYLTVLGGA